MGPGWKGDDAGSVTACDYVDAVLVRAPRARRRIDRRRAGWGRLVAAAALRDSRATDRTSSAA